MSVQSSPGGRGSVVVGIGLAVLAYLLFSLQDATIKWLATGFMAPQILLMRSVVIVPLCMALGLAAILRAEAAAAQYHDHRIGPLQLRKPAVLARLIG